MTFLEGCLKSHISFHCIPISTCLLGYSISLKLLLCKNSKQSCQWSHARALISKRGIEFMGLRKELLKHTNTGGTGGTESCLFWCVTAGPVLPCLSLFFRVTGLHAELSYVRNDVVNHYALSFNLLIPSETNSLHFSWHAKSKVSRHDICG